MSEVDFDVAIVGAGITGLSTAWLVQQQHPLAKIAIFEQQEHVGGRIDAAKVGPIEVELGADAALGREIAVADLISSLGLLDDIVGQKTEQALLYYDNELRPLPRATAFGLPVSVRELKNSGFLSDEGARTFKKLVRTNFAPEFDDMSLGAFVRARLGNEVAERIVDPLLGSIHAAPIDQLSLEATSPQLAEFARSGGNVHDVLEPKKTLRDRPTFVSLRHGMPQLTSRLHEQLTHIGTKFLLKSVVENVQIENEKPVVVTADGKRTKANAVVLASPSYVTAQLIEPLSAEASQLLGSIAHSSVAMCVLVFKKSDVPTLPNASGFLTGHDSLLVMTACSFATQKWERYNDDEHVVFRVSAGRADDDRAFAMADADLVRLLNNEISNILNIKGLPVAATLRRWPKSFPQYEVGHLQKVDDIEEALRQINHGLLTAGASYRGVGTPACIRQAIRAAEAIEQFV
jgi:oxygen-dependent protoporphyrinogen oxidase